MQHRLRCLVWALALLAGSLGGGAAGAHQVLDPLGGHLAAARRLLETTAEDAPAVAELRPASPAFTRSESSPTAPRRVCDVTAAPLAAGLVVERNDAGAWLPIGAAELLVGFAPNRGEGVPVALRNGWPRGVRRRVQISSAIRDLGGRAFEGDETFEWLVPAGTLDSPAPAVRYERKFPLVFDSAAAAAATISGRLRARWYDPRNASWLSEDQLEDVDSVNLYAFVVHSPSNYSDPRGLVLRTLPVIPLPSLEDVGAFFAGVGQGLSESFSFGTNPAARPRSSDTPARRVGQGVGSGLAMLAGAGGAVGGGAATVVVCSADAASAPTLVGPALLTPACVGAAGFTAASAGVAASAGNYISQVASEGTTSSDSAGSSGEPSQEPPSEVLPSEPAAEPPSGTGDPPVEANPLEGTRYTAKVRQQMRPHERTGAPDNHGFPLEVDNFAGSGTTRELTGRDGVVSNEG